MGFVMYLFPRFFSNSSRSSGVHPGEILSRILPKIPYSNGYGIPSAFSYEVCCQLFFSSIIRNLSREVTFNSILSYHNYM